MMIDPNNVAFYKAKGRRSSRYATYTYSVKEWTYQQIRHYDWGVVLNTIITRSDWPEVSVNDYKSTGDLVYLKSVKYKNLPSVVKKMVRENLETLHNRTEGDCMKKLIAFKGKQTIKDKYIARVEKHQKADEIIQGTYWQNGKGCAVGCTMEHNNMGESIHQKMEHTLGIPRILCRLEDRIFEGLENKEAKKFPLAFLSAIPVGADLSFVWPKFIVWLLVDKKDGVIKYARPDGKKAIQAVADTYKRLIAGEKIDINEWLEKRRAAADAAYATAYAAAAAYAAYAAYAADAAYATAYAAAAYATAYAAAAAYAADAAYARKQSFKKMAKKLIQLLKKAPIKA